MEGINYKIKKYLNKIQQNNKKKYLYKLSTYIYNLLILKSYKVGGKPIIKKLDINKEIDSIEEINKKKIINILNLNNFIKDTFSDKQLYLDDQKFFIILMGSPGVGKTIARKVVLTKLFPLKDKIFYDKMYNTFIDISIDDYIYSYYDENNINGLQIILDASKHILDKINSIDEIYSYSNNTLNRIESKSHILNELYKLSSDSYYSIRNKLKSIGDIMMYIAIYMGFNIYFETTGANYIYVFRLIKEIINVHHYKLIIIYPYLLDNYIHAQRLFERGKIEGRLPNIEEVIKQKSIIDDNYNTLNNYFNKDLSKVSFYKYESIDLIQSDIQNYNFESIICT